MPPKRKISQRRTKWTDQMVLDLMTCRAQALARYADASKTENNNGKRKRYMGLMKDLWEDKSYASFGFTAQYLYDNAAQVQKVKKVSY